jgi:hypothetical protein
LQGIGRYVLPKMCTSRLSVSIIAKRIIRGIAFIILGGALIFAFMMRSANWDGDSLDKMFSGEPQEQPSDSD